MSERSAIKMNPGRQEEAAACTADIMFYGGAAGAGKTFLFICEPLRFVHLPDFGAIFFRRLSTMLTGPGSAFEEAKKIYPNFKGRMREGNVLDARFASGAIVQFSHLQYEDDIDAHQSKQYAIIIFDEVTQFTEQQFWYLLSRNRTTCGVRPYMRGGCNPDPDSWVAKMIEWWIGDEGYPIEERSGVLRWFVRDDDGDKLVWFGTKGEALLYVRKNFSEDDRPDPASFTFIAAKLEDNPALMKKDPSYKSKLLMLPRVEREQLLKGNWKIKRGAGTYFNRNWVTEITAVPNDLVEVWRWWDKAATEPSTSNADPDWTAGMMLGRRKNGRTIVLHGIRFRKTPGEVQTRMKSAAERDGRGVKVGVWQDPGAAGKADVMHDAKNLLGFVMQTEVAKENKETYFMPFSAACENGLVDVLVDGLWDHEAWYDELEGFAGSKGPGKKDQVDATSGAFLKLSKSNADTFAVLSRWRPSVRMQT